MRMASCNKIASRDSSSNLVSVKEDKSCVDISNCNASKDVNKPDSDLSEENDLGHAKNDTVPGNENVPAYLEGGWGWVVVFACFFNSFILDGIASSFGLIYPYVLEKFQASSFVTSIPGSMLISYLLMGSLAAALIKRYGFRKVAIMGGLLSCLAFVGASFSPNIYLFILTFGVLGGAGIGMVYLPSMVIVNCYFNQKRGITNGIISSGSGFGLFVLAPFINKLLVEYSLSGTTLILAGVLLNICVFSALLKQPKSHTAYGDGSKDCEIICEKFNDSASEDDTEESTVGSHSLEHIDMEESHKQYTKMEDSRVACVNTKRQPGPPIVFSHADHIDLDFDNENDTNTFLGKSDNFLLKRGQIDHRVSGKLQSVDNVWKQTRPSHSSMQSVFQRLTAGHPHRYMTPAILYSDIGANSYLSGSTSRLMEFHQQNFSSSRHLQTTQSQSFEKVLSKENIMKSKSLADNRTFPDTPQGEDLLTCSKSVNNYCCSGSEDLQRTPKHCQEPLGYSIRELMKMPSFHLFYCGACLIQFGFPIPSIFLADLASKHGVPTHQGAILLSLIGSFNIGGRLLAGFVGNLNVNPIRLNNVALFLAAVLCFLCPLYTTMLTLSIFAALYGFLLGFFPPLQPLVIVKYFGIESLASTFGFVTSMKGIAGLIGPPLAGWIYDLSSDYSFSIIFAGVAFILSVIVNEIMAFVADSTHCDKTREAAV